MGVALSATLSSGMPKLQSQVRREPWWSGLQICGEQDMLIQTQRFYSYGLAKSYPHSMYEKHLLKQINDMNKNCRDQFNLCK